MPAACEVPLFCGVVLSGAMDTVDWPLLDAFEGLAADRGKNVQVLFHPVSVPIEQCLDPENAPFAAACASEARNREAERLRYLAETHR